MSIDPVEHLRLQMIVAKVQSLIGKKGAIKRESIIGALATKPPAPAPSTPLPPVTPTPGELGRPKVQDGKMVWPDGTLVRAKMANFMTHEHHGNADTIVKALDVMGREWGLDGAVFGYASRAVLENTKHPYSTIPYLDILDTAVDAAGKRKQLALYGPRYSGIEGRLTDGGPPTHQQYVGPPPQEAIDSLVFLAKRYANAPHVMFKCQIEYNGGEDAWEPVRAYSQKCVDAIRVTGSQAIVMTSGHGWGRMVNGAIDAPVKGENVMYAPHPYGRQSAWQDWFGKAVDAGLPVFFAEFGPMNFGEPAVMEEKDYTALMAYAERHGIGWAAWAAEFPQNPTLLADGSDRFAPSTPFGERVKAAMLNAST